MTASRIRVILLVFVLVTAAVGPVLAQEGGENETDPFGNTSAGNTTGSSPTNNSSVTGGLGTGASTGSGGSESGEQAYGSGYLSDRAANRSTGPNGSINIGGNNSTNSSGLSSDASGIKGTAINAALDVVARFLEFISNQIANALSFILQEVFGTITYTPAPPSGNMYQAVGGDSFWGGIYNSYKTLWQPLALAIAALLTGVYVGLGRFGLDMLPAHVQQQGFMHLGLAWIMASDISWTLMGIILDFTSLINRALVGSIELENGLVGGAGLALVGLILFYLLGFWIVIAMVLIFAFRIVGMIALTPMMPAVFAARAIPVKGVSDMMDSLWRFWLYLVILPLPVGAVLAVGFGPDMQQVMQSAGLAGAFLSLALQVGTIVGAIVLPYILYQRSGAGMMSVGVVGSASTERVREALGRQQEQVDEGREQGQQTSQNLPGRVGRMAVKARKVGIMSPGGLSQDNAQSGGGGGGGGSGGSNEVYVNIEERRRRLQQ
ncbi:hypothetical protein [Halococcus sp. PRR34]|uniref:hypothetical protein n=1 Tax=Halococcus sp. PRR34 TaxID=3020830 RepID=UPI002360F16F|nr:hypothetical protein [Halococcus sp. PRR34]